MFLISLNDRERRRSLLVWLSAFAVLSLVAIGIFAKNGWFLSEPPALAGGRRADTLVRSSDATSLSPSGATLPSATPQLSKEYVYAGSRLLAVEDANASASPPADLAVWRPSSGTWYVMGGAGSQAVTQSWGTNGDVPVPGDFDGDGKTDFSVFRPSSGEWYVLRSSDSSWDTVIAWGNASDFRVPADFDGDGKTDRAVWRASDGIWYIIASSTGSATYSTFGSSGDVPAPADYDGDGRADLAVWRDSNHTFYSLNSSNNANQTISLPTAAANSLPVSADYDGDGKADFAIRSGASWIVLNSATAGNSATLTTIPWQLATDIAVHNDYDGDGKVDIAVWRPTDSPSGTLGNWYIRQSATNGQLRQESWGTTGDIPVPAFYRR